MMLNCKPGDKRFFETTVSEKDTAAFQTGEVHPVYSTFALARDAEWACRQFVLEMKEEDEEGIGTSITVNHQSPALIGEKVKFEAVLESAEGNEIICNYAATVGDRIIAHGQQRQKILKKKKLRELFQKLEKKNG